MAQDEDRALFFSNGAFESGAIDVLRLLEENAIDSCVDPAAWQVSEAVLRDNFVLDEVWKIR